MRNQPTRALAALALLTLTTLSGCVGSEGGLVPWDYEPPAEDDHGGHGTETPHALDADDTGTPDAPDATVVDGTPDAVDRSGYPYHESPEDGVPDYANSTWDPVALTGFDHTYRPLNNRSDGSPYGVHLSFADDPKTTLTVTWFTAGADVDVQPVVQWGTDPADLSQEAPATSAVAYPGDPAISEENPMDVAVHEATLTGLEPGQTVWYRVSGSSGDSPVYSGHTDPGPDATVRIAHWGDQGVIYDGSKNTTGFVLAMEELPDLIVIAGDLTYADGIQWKWDDYFWYFEPLFARVPLMAAPGNHEGKDGEFFEGFRTRFAFPGNEVQYQFQYGPAVITTVDTEGEELLAPGAKLAEGNPAGAATGVPAAAQSYAAIPDLLRQAQAAKDAGDASWSLVLQHVPIYSNHNTRGNAYQLAALEEPWLVQFDVDLLMAGHNHHYERSKPMAFGEPNDDGWVQVINGGGGKSHYEFLPAEDFAAWSAAWAKRSAVVEYEVSPASLEGTAWATDNDFGTTGVREILDTWTMTA